MTGDENWIFYDNPKKKKYYAKPGQSLTSTSTLRPNIHIWFEDHALYLVGPKESCLLWAAETWRFHHGRSISATIDRLSRVLREKRPEYEQRHDKVILLHDNARPHIAKVVKKYLETLKWDVLPHPLYSPDIAPSDYFCCSEGCSTIWQVTGSFLS